MNFFEKLINSLMGEMETPTNYGWFHLMFIAIVILSTVFLCIKFRDCDDKIFRRIVLIGWCIIVVLEIYKQIIFSFNLDGTKVSWDYQWYAFPFQFCSTPLYTLPFVVFLKDGKVRDAVIAYISTFSLFAGVAVMLYPNDVFISLIGINIQTMIHHGLQVIFGIFFACHARKKLNLRFYLSSIIVFAVFSSIAILLNVLVHKMFILKSINEDFNMFYISPYYRCTLPILSDIYDILPYVAFLLVYLIGFALVSLLMFGIEKGVLKVSYKVKKNDKLKKV